MSRLSDYDYELPPELIAQTPLERRSDSRLLHLHKDTGRIEHLKFSQVPDLLRPGDLLVLNDTRVSAVRLIGTKATGGEVEALLLSPLGDGRYEALMRPGRRLKPGIEVNFGPGLEAVVEEVRDGGRRLLRFSQPDGLRERLAVQGQVPLPPYITEKLADPRRYQTVFAAKDGSSAAPTAALHFTEDLLDKLREKGVETATVTLDVGIDTFRPVQAENLEEHRMHGERCEVSPETAERVARCKGRVIAVGTTSVRTLETFAAGPRRLETGVRESKLFIRPGFNFRIVDGMLTNFHLPRTTMLVMLSALCPREKLFRAYDEAVRERYRFLSFGDSMLIL